MGSLKEKFDEAIKVDTDECIIWHYTIDNAGYGQIRYKGKIVGVHRLALLLTIGKPPKGKPFALHKPDICHNPSCFNPRHLYWGDGYENMADKILDGTDNKGEKHGQSKLTESQVLAIRADTRVQRLIAEEYGIGHSYVSYIKNKKSWKHLEPVEEG